MASHPPRHDASRSRSPLHGPDPHNPPLSLGTIESHEFFTRWRPVLLMVQFHELCLVEEGQFHASFMMSCRESSVPELCRSEEQAIFTYTTFLDRHQLNFPFSGVMTELLFQIGQTWGFILSCDDIKLTFPHPEGHNTFCPEDMYVREFLDIQRPDWTITALNQPFVFRLDCRANEPDPIINHP